MTRISLTDDSGKWFDADAAVRFKENTRWDGRNHVSEATGSQWEHEGLYFTRSGNWVLNCWSQYQNVPESYSEIRESQAVAWLIRQECMEDEGIAKLPPNVQKSLAQAFAEAEL